MNTDSPIARPLSTSADANQVAWRHLRWGWWSLLAFLMLGIVLEAMH